MMRRRRRMGLARVLPLGIGMASSILGAATFGGCGGGTTAASRDDGGLDAPKGSPDGGDGAIEAEAEAEAGPIVYCSDRCGTVSGPDAGSSCNPGQICGQSGGVVGFGCCDPAGPSICMPGYPGPGSNCP